MLKCGFYEAEITPPIGCEMPGQIDKKITLGVKDELYAKAFAVRVGCNTAVFIALDALNINDEFALLVRERASALTGLPPENFMVSATHTHTGAPLTDLYGSTKDDSCISWIAKRSADAAYSAFRDMRPAKIGYGCGELHNAAFNRRYIMKDGSVKTNPGIKNPDILRAESGTDDQVSVVRIDSIDNEPMGVIVNFACHPDTVGGLEYSADYPGALSRFLKGRFGSGFISVFFNGCCGDINHIDATGENPILPEHYKMLGEKLGEDVMRVYSKIKTGTRGKIGTGRAFLAADVRPVTGEMRERAESVLKSRESSRLDMCLSESVLKLAAKDLKQRKLEIMAVELGDAVIIGLPGEIFHETGLKIKRSSPFRDTIVCEMANGCNGYIATQKAHGSGSGYEVQLTEYTYLAAGTEPELVKKSVELLNRLHNGEN